MQIMPEIYLTDAQLDQKFISSMEPSYSGVPGNNTKPQEEVPIQKQEQCTQDF